MRSFHLQRDVDVSGVSGIGRVAEGVEFSNGKVALCWLSAMSSIGIYNSMLDMQLIHGHDASTKVIYDR